MDRACPACFEKSISVTGLILSDTRCPNCGELVGVRWLFKAFFFLLILVTTVALGLIVLVDQGPYAALLIISLPIGAIGFIKARFSPLVVNKKESGAEESN